MKNLIDLVNRSFKNSDELNNKMAKVNELKIQFVSSLNNEQCIKFLKLCVEIEELQKNELKEYIKHTYKVCKNILSLMQAFMVARFLCNMPNVRLLRTRLDKGEGKETEYAIERVVYLSKREFIPFREHLNGRYSFYVLSQGRYFY